MLLGHRLEQLDPFEPPRRHIVGSVPCDVAAPAQGPNTLQVVGVRALAQGRLMVRFQAPGPTACGAAVAVALEHGAADGGPAAGVEVDVEAAQSPCIPLLNPLGEGSGMVDMERHV